MRVLHVPRRFVREDWGGTEQVIAKTVCELENLGVTGEIFTTLALSDKNTEVIENVRVRRFDYFYPYWGLSQENRLDMDKKGGNLFSFALARALYSENNLDLLHSHTGKRLGGIVRTVAKLRKIPYVVSLHGGFLQIPQAERATLAAPAQNSFEWGKALGAVVGSRKVLSDADGIICVGRTEYEKMKEKYPLKGVYYLPNGVDTSWFENGNGQEFRTEYGYTPKDKIILTVGRIDPQKNQELLIKLMPRLLETEPDAKLLLIGPVTLQRYYEKLMGLITSLHIEEKVQIIKGFPPGDRTLVDAFHGSDLFVLPSRHEPFGIVLLEAWSSSLPVIASNVGGIPHIIKDGDTGVMCRSDDEQDFLHSIVNILRDKSYGKYLAERGREQAKSTYEWKSVCSYLKRIYEEVIDRHRCERGLSPKFAREPVDVAHTMNSSEVAQ